MTRILLLAAFLTFLPPAFAQDTMITERVWAHTEHLASDALRGRGTGSADARIAAEYIAKQFESIGLEAYAEGSYLQEFELPQDAGGSAGVIESNVIGFIAARKETSRSIVVTAHYDACGVIETPGTDDEIHNGALDNAVGVSSMIEPARSVHASAAPRLNVVFFATAEEDTMSVAIPESAARPSSPRVPCLGTR